MYYRIAIRVDASPTWKWKSTALSSLNTLFHWLQCYRVLPHDRLRIFSSSSQEELNEQLVRENQGLLSTSVPATQFLQERGIAPREVGGQASAGGTRANERTAPIAAVTEPEFCQSNKGGNDLDGKGMSSLERRRLELESGAGADHDVSYIFLLPLSVPQVLAWMRLMGRVQRGELQP